MNTMSKTRKLTFLGAMLAITIIMDMTPILGAIPLPGVSATITHVPTIITGIILGPISGLIMGTFFGIISLLHALMRPASPLDPLFINPLLSVLPRMAIGVMSYYSYTLVRKLLSGFKPYIGVSIGSAIGGFIGSMTNTVLVLTMMYFVYGKKILDIFIAEGWMGSESKLMDIRNWVLGLAASSGIPEALVAAFLSVVLVLAYKRVIEKTID